MSLTPPSLPLAFGPFVLDAANARLLRDGEPVELAPRPFALLTQLVARAGQLLTKDELLDAVWGHRHVSESVLKVAVNTLRERLADDPRAPLYIETASRRGYRFVAPVRTLAPAPPAAPAAGNLPLVPPELVGRDDDAAALQALLAAHRLVTLTGSAGVGKTRLAVHTAARIPSRRDGAWLVRLDALADPAPIVATIARTLGLSADTSRSADALAQALRPLSLLLVLDNCEHLLGALAPLVARLLAEAPRVTVLATSREPLHVEGEQVLRLAPLAVPPPGPLDPARPGPSVELFVARARSLDRAFALGEHDRDAVADICRRLDGLPLAIELAAARVPLLGVAGVRDRLRERLELLAGGGGHAGSTRHRTLRSAIEWSHALLSPRVQQVFRRLAVFSGSFTLDAAQATAAFDGLDAWRVLDGVGALVDKSLLIAHDERGVRRLRMLDSIRAYAAQRLAQAGEERTARRRHADAMVAQFAAADANVHDVPVYEWAERLLPDVDNLRGALAFAVSPDGDPALAAALVAHSMMFWQRAGLKHEGRRWLDAVRGCDVGRLSRDVRAGLLRADAVQCVYGNLGLPADAMRSLHAALELQREAGDALGVYFGLYLLHHLMIRVDPAADRRALADEMAVLEAPDWPPLRCRYGRWARALLLRDAGDVDGYRAFCVAELARCRAAGDRFLEWTATYGLALGEHDAGRSAEAIALLEPAVAEIRVAGRLREQTPVIALLASILIAEGDLAEGLPMAREAVALLRVDAMVWWMAPALPWIAAWQGRSHDAARLQGWAGALVRRRGERRGILFTRLEDTLRARLTQLFAPDALAALVREGEAFDEETALVLAGVAD